MTEDFLALEPVWQHLSLDLKDLITKGIILRKRPDRATLKEAQQAGWLFEQTTQN